ncbi:MAG TPA: TonB-dependent receptor [Stellaceae bacterium]|nr:TonB-dependent receptor [Stellaceae bacterium]
MTRCATSAVALCVSVAGLGFVLPAAAQQAATSGDQLQEVVVTASKRAGTVQDTPISVTAVTGDEIQDRGITDFNSLAQATPGVSLKSSGPGQTEFEIRGLTSSGGNSPTVGFYLDDTPLTAPSAAQNGKVVIDPALYDLNRVEVLRGPQGTLYGSGSMGGTIKVITNQPDPTKFDASAESILSGTDGGGFNHGENAMLNVPLVDDVLALRLVGSEAYTSGWIDRVVIAPGAFPLETNNLFTRGNVSAAPVATTHDDVNDEELLGTRVSLLWKATDNLTITPSFMYQRVTQGGPNTFDSDPATLAHYEAFDVAEPFSDRFILWSVNATYHLEDFDVISTTARWKRDEAINQDESENIQWAFALPSFYPPNGLGIASISEADYSRQFSNEERITSNGDTAFKWLVGSYYSSFRSDWDLVSEIPGLAGFGLTPNLIDQIQPTTITQTAAYGDASYQVTDDIKVEMGLRWYSYQDQLDTAVSGVVSPTGTNAIYYARGTEADEGFNPRFVVSYQPDPDLTVYTSAAKGFRPGGGNQPIPTGPTGLGPACLAALEALGRTEAPPFFGPDSIWSYELGEKARLLDGHLTLDSSGYYENWTGVQQEIALSCGFPYNDNAGKARVYGGEIEFHALVVPGLIVTGSVSYDHGRISQGSRETGIVAGDRLQDVPDWTTSLIVSYTTPINDEMAFTARVENDYVDTRRDATFFQRNDLPAYDLTNIRAGVTTDSWAAFLFVNNLFDKRAWIADNNSLSINLPTFNRVSTNQPLTVGLDLTWHFGGAETAPPAAAPLPPAPPPPPPPPQVEAQRQFQVFFDFDKSNITEAAAKVIQAASDAVKAGNVVHLTVTGHTDTVGTASYNQGLSERRAASVKAELVRDGVDGGEIATVGVGKTGLLVPTADGVREPQNRRAVIELQ